MHKLDLEKAEISNCQHPLNHREQGNSRKTSTSASLTMLKLLTVWITTNWKILRDGNTRPPYLPPEKPVWRTRSNSKNQIWNDGLVQNHILSVSCHPVYLTYVLSTSWEMQGWMKHKLKSILPGEISITSDIHMMPPLWKKTKRNLRDYLWMWKRRGKKLA